MLKICDQELLCCKKLEKWEIWVSGYCCNCKYERKELDPSRLLNTSEGCCCWEQRPLLLLTDKEELAGLAQPDKKGDRNLRMLTLRWEKDLWSLLEGWTSRISRKHSGLCCWRHDFLLLLYGRTSASSFLLSGVCSSWNLTPLAVEVGWWFPLNFGAQFQWLEGLHQSEKHESGTCEAFLSG